MNLNLFQNENDIFDPASCFHKVVTIKYECNLEILHNQIKDLSYHGLKNFRSIFIAYLIQEHVCETMAASEKFWERKIKEIELKFNYVHPKSMTDDAVRKRFNL